MEEPLVHESGPVPAGPARVAAAACGVAVLLLLGFCGFYVYEIGQGATDDVVRAVMSIVLMLVFAVGLAALARGWLALKAWPRTPTMLWHALLLPVAWGLFQGHRPWIGVAVGGLALLGILAGAAARPEDPAASR
jgi:hypothetical protein